MFPKREKVELVDVPSKDNTRTCSSCGHVNASSADLMITCTMCGKVHDQDENAAWNARNFALQTLKSADLATT